MTGSRAPQRRSPPVVIWLTVGLVAGSILACLAMGLVAWREAEQIEALQTQVGSLQHERQVTEGHLAALQGTASVMENRLVTLEANDPAQQLAELQAAVETATEYDELGDLEISLTSIQARIDAFQSSLDDLSTRMTALEPSLNGAPLPTEVHLTVERQRQTHNLSCESSAASMAAQYHGIAVSEEDIIAALPRNDNPHLGFRGNVDGPTGGTQDYGVYAGPIVAVLNGYGLRARQIDGEREGIQAAVTRGNPVIVWVPYDCGYSSPVETTISGDTVTLVPNQHVVVITGYNALGVWANDPWDGQEDFYSYEDLERAMGYFGDMAIEIAAP